VVPASTLSSLSATHSFIAAKTANGIEINTTFDASATEVWSANVTWKREERNGRISASVQTKGLKRWKPGGKALPAPSAEEINHLLLAWADDAQMDALVVEAIRNGGSLQRWDARGVAAFLGWWMMMGLFVTALVLAIGRAAVKRYFEKCIAAWHDGKCPQCRYAMEGTRSGRCPECGCVGAEHVRMLEGILRGRPPAIAASTCAGYRGG
jgi:hypothetical protein